MLIPALSCFKGWKMGLGVGQWRGALYAHNVFMLSNLDSLTFSFKYFLDSKSFLGMQHWNAAKLL